MTPEISSLFNGLTIVTDKMAAEMVPVSIVRGVLWCRINRLCSRVFYGQGRVFEWSLAAAYYEGALRERLRGRRGAASSAMLMIRLSPQLIRWTLALGKRIVLRQELPLATSGRSEL